MKIEVYIESLVQYAHKHLYLPEEDGIYCRNRLIEALKVSTFTDPDELVKDIEEIKERLIAYGYEQGILQHRGTSFEDNFIAYLMDIVMPSPSAVTERFYKDCSVSEKLATDNYYNFSVASDYIKSQRLKKNIQWKVQGSYGLFELTINLAKPEKTPDEIIQEKEKPQDSSYPKCVLCKETQGLSGAFGAPRQNHRIIPMTFQEEPYFLQYSPYAYFHEHCIVLHRDHIPMKIDEKAVDILLSFVDMFPHYMISSNADLPLVGGSILSHDHFQGGKHVFPIEKSPSRWKKTYGSVEANIIRWPLSTILLRSKDRGEILKAAGKILTAWGNYDNEELEILSKGEAQHSTCNLAARKLSDGTYHVYLVLRNNRRTKEHPEGLFHTKPQYWHLKQENIGIIEVMGLAILPGRLVEELQGMELYFTQGKVLENTKKHIPWLDEIKADFHGEFSSFIQEKMGIRFEEILACCGVFKEDEAGTQGMIEFIESSLR